MNERSKRLFEEADRLLAGSQSAEAKAVVLGCKAVVEAIDGPSLGSEKAEPPPAEPKKGKRAA